METGENEKDYYDWKEQELLSIEQDIKYHEEKLKELRMRLRIIREAEHNE